MTLDKPKTSFSFQGTPGSNSLLFFSFLFSCLLSEGSGGEEEEEEEEYVPSAEWTLCKIPFPHSLGWLPEATSSSACEEPVGPASLGWAVLLHRGATAEVKVPLLRSWDGSWEWQSWCCHPGGSRCPSVQVLSSPATQPCWRRWLRVVLGGWGWLVQPPPPACGPSEAFATSGCGD